MGPLSPVPEKISVSVYEILPSGCTAWCIQNSRVLRSRGQRGMDGDSFGIRRTWSPSQNKVELTGLLITLFAQVPQPLG